MRTIISKVYNTFQKSPSFFCCFVHCFHCNVSVGTGTKRECMPTMQAKPSVSMLQQNNRLVTPFPGKKCNVFNFYKFACHRFALAGKWHIFFEMAYFQYEMACIQDTEDQVICRQGVTLSTLSGSAQPDYRVDHLMKDFMNAVSQGEQPCDYNHSPQSEFTTSEHCILGIPIFRESYDFGFQGFLFRIQPYFCLKLTRNYHYPSVVSLLPPPLVVSAWNTDVATEHNEASSELIRPQPVPGTFTKVCDHRIISLELSHRTH